MRQFSLLAVSLLVLITSLKLINIDGGFVPAEPDERNYLVIVDNFRSGLLPHFDGIPLFHSPPLFHYLGFVSSFIFPGYLGIRMVSLFASLILGIIMFFYLKTKISPLAAALSSGLFLLLPLIVYYSRLGLLEILVTLFAFGFITAFERSWTKNSYRWALVSGLCLGFGFISKYSLLPLVAVPVLVFSFSLLTEVVGAKSVKVLLKPKTWRKVLLLIVLGLSAAVIVLPVTYLNYSLHPLEFKSQFKQTFALGGRPFEWSVVIRYLQNLPSYFTPAVVVLFLAGVFGFLRDWKKNLPIFFSILVLAFALFRISLYSPRYIVILTPFLFIPASYGIELLLTYKKINLPWRAALVAISVLVLVMPSSWIAIRASHHQEIEKVGTFVRAENEDNKWVGTNYWPSAFVNEVGYKISWYSLDEKDSGTLSSGGKTQYLPPNEPLTEVIKREGGWLIVEDLFSPQLSQRRERSGPVEMVTTTQEPVKIFIDSASNWPYLEKDQNTISVYKILPK
jgi:4-amino-4-deoxy-L-arabinose transferase-like glycosyltransferase